MKNQKFIKKSFPDPDPLSERRSGVEKNILKHMKQLSIDNLFVLLSYAHDLLQEQIQEERKEEMIQNGKQILNISEMNYREFLQFCIDNNLFCFEYHYRKKQSKQK